jgi:small subunit ribosomal protein S3
MIERKFIAEKLKEFQIEEYVASNIKRVGHSKTRMTRTPLGEKIVIHASRPGLVVGRKGENIKKLTKDLKNKFKLDNPQIEISEVQNPGLDPKIVAERIVNSLERFGTAKFKGIGHKALSDAMASGALGIEITISGKVPSSRARVWRFYQGYLKKCGNIAIEGVQKSYAQAQLKSGVVGIYVAIMPPDVILPDKVEMIKEGQLEEVTVDEEAASKKKEKPKAAKPKSRSKPKKKASKKKEESKGSEEEQADSDEE